MMNYCYRLTTYRHSRMYLNNHLYILRANHGSHLLSLVGRVAKLEIDGCNRLLVRTHRRFN
jgi:hypothetical protein